MQPSFSYTRKDYDTIKVFLQRMLQAKFPTTWKNVYESDVGVMWMEIVAAAFDQLSYFVDHQANETYLGTAQDRESIVNIVKLVGYQPRNPTAASVQCNFTLPSLDVFNVVIPAGTAIDATGGTHFEALSDIVIPIGQISEYGYITAGTTAFKDFTSDGSKFLKILLTDSTWINGSISVIVDGVTWSEVDSLLEGDASSKIFSIDVASNQNVYICFGDNISGSIPPNASSIRIYYRTGGGVTGNIGIGEINQSVQGYKEGTSPIEYVSVAVTNEDTGSGGEDAEDINSIKLWAPKWARTNNRAVTEEDFDTLAARFNDPVYGSPARAKAVLKREVPELNSVLIYLWSRDNTGKFTKPSTSLKNAVQAYFDNNGSGGIRLICVDTEVLDGEIVYIDLGATVTIESTAKSDTVVTAINQALNSLFDSTFNQPGTSVRLSKLYETIMGVSGVKHCLIDSAAGIIEYEEQLSPSSIVQQWSGTLDSVPLWGMYPGEVVFTDGLQVVRDDGNGHLVGNVDPTGVNLVKYIDKEFVGIYVGASGFSHYTYTITDVPVIPGSVKIYSDNQIISDNGGKLVGDVDPLGVNTIDYATGIIDVTFLNSTNSAVRLNYYMKERGWYDFTFASAPDGSIPITANYKSLSSYYKDEDMAVGDGSTKTFDYVLKNPPTFRKSIAIVDTGSSHEIENSNGDGGAYYVIQLGSVPIPGSLVITAGAQVVLDTGYGQLTGDVDSTLVNAIDYSSGRVVINFASIVPVGIGNILIEYDIPSNIIILDDGYKTLKGAVDTSKISTVDYSRGSINVSFLSAPLSGNKINVHYLSLLNSPSEDMYITKKQLASINTVSITIKRE